jgi:phosphatidylglycerophosphate synthase
MAAVRAGIRRVGVPAIFRGTALERAIVRTPAARAAAVWLAAGPAPARAEPLILLPAAALVPPAAVAAVAGGPPAALAGDSGPPLVAAGAGLVATLWTALARGEPVGAVLEGAARAGGLRPGARTAGVLHVASVDAKRRAEALLDASLASPLDTRLDSVLHRRASRQVSRLAVAWGITPNQLTLASLAIGVAAAWCFARPAPAGALVGLVLYGVSVILDHADGEVARLTLAESKVGEWLDVVADTVVHALVVLAVGLAAGSVAGPGAVLLGAVAATGVPASALLAKLWPPPAASLGGLLQGLSNRNGFYAMLAGFIVVRALAPAALPAFLLLVALGLHGFWVGALAARLAGRRRKGG